MPPMPDLTAARFVVAGRVQGVNFRWATTRAARELGVAGWVRNRPDGRVEVLAQGPPGAVDALAGFLAEGPPHAAVTGVERSLAAVDPTLGEFSVRY